MPWASRLQHAAQHLRTSSRIGRAQMIMPWVEIPPFLDCNVGGNILPAIPINPVSWRRECLPEAVDLFHLIVAPGRVTSLGDPDFRRRVVSVKHRPHRPKMRVIAEPSASFTVPCAGKGVEADGGYRLKYAALPHELKPMRVERAGPTQDRFPTT